MLPILFLFISIWIVLKSGIWREVFFYINFLILLFVGLMHWLEIISSNTSTLILHNDIISFLNIASLPVSEIFQYRWRYSLFAMWYKDVMFWFGFRGIFISLIPFFVIFISLLYVISNKNRLLLILFPFFLTFYYYLPFIGYRDIILHCIILLFAAAINKHNAVNFFAIAFVLASVLVFLRYQWALLLIASYLITFIYIHKNIFSKKFYSHYLVIHIILLVPVIYFFIIYQDFILDRISRALSVRDEEVIVAKFPSWTSYLLALVRQLLTPLPSSLFSQWFDGQILGTNFVRDLTRMVMMTFFYIGLLYLISNANLALRIIHNNKGLIFLFVFSFGNTILYAVYGDGGGSSRNKTFPIILVLLVLVEILRIKYARRRLST